MAHVATTGQGGRASSSARAHSCQQILSTQAGADAASDSKPGPDCTTLTTAPCSPLQPDTPCLESVASTMLSLQANAMPKHWTPDSLSMSLTASSASLVSSYWMKAAARSSIGVGYVRRANFTVAGHPPPSAWVRGWQVSAGGVACERIGRWVLFARWRACGI